VTPAVPRQSRVVRMALAVLAATTLLVGVAGAGEARAARGMELALQDDSLFVQGKYRYSLDSAYRHLRSLGVTRLKVNVLWAYTMPRDQYNARTKPAQINWDFSQYDTAIDQAARNGIRVHAALTGPAPRWASGRRRIDGYKPNSRHFGEFAGVAAEHFRGRVDRYSIWNEPNWGTWLGPIKSQASLYRGLFTRGYSAIKQADRRAKVLIGETSPSRSRTRGGRALSQSPMTFLRSLACVNKQFRRVRSCPALRADGYAHHPYDFRHAPNFVPRNPDDVTMGNLSTLTRTLDRLSRARRLRKNGGGRMPVYLTEYGYFSSGRRAVKKSLRTRWLSQAYTIALRNGRVKSQLQYLLLAPPRRSDQAFFNLALLTTSGKKRYPQYNTLQRWYRGNRGRVKRPRGAISLPAAPAQPTS
jgi:hypothetical protein